MYKDDSTRLAVMANEHGPFVGKFTITEYWKNGNIKRVAIYKRHSRHYWCYNYYSNEILSSRGKYRNNKKIGRWVYVNTNKRKIRVEHYASDGTLKKTKNIKPPRGTLSTFFMVARPEGSPYIVK
jgi:antitoxin component YwqK of YwqJK toxin-antitoxin module